MCIPLGTSKLPCCPTRPAVRKKLAGFLSTLLRLCHKSTATDRHYIANPHKHARALAHSLSLEAYASSNISVKPTTIFLFIRAGLYRKSRSRFAFVPWNGSGGFSILGLKLAQLCVFVCATVGAPRAVWVCCFKAVFAASSSRLCAASSAVILWGLVGSSHFSGFSKASWP